VGARLILSHSRLTASDLRLDLRGKGW